MDIGPLKSKAGEFAFPQGKHDILPALPIRALALGPGSSGKTNMLVTLITDPRFFRGAFEHLYWLSPTSSVDDSLQPLRDYVRDHLKQDQEEDPTFHDTLEGRGTPAQSHRMDEETEAAAKEGIWMSHRHR